MPKCIGKCGRPALDGKLTCGDVRCSRRAFGADLDDLASIVAGHAQTESAGAWGSGGEGDQGPPAAAYLRCLVTGNICGTDTWAAGHDCACENCKRWLQCLDE